MCGIAGIYSLQTQSVTPQDLRRMGDLLCWRGPDDEGFLLANPGQEPVLFGGSDSPEETLRGGLPYLPNQSTPPAEITGGLGLTFRRLSIQDLSASGHQPMCDASKRYWLIFNGEIYNFHELRAELESLGHRFVSTGDAAVILEAYAEWGPDCLSRFNGMWGLAIWDSKQAELFLARDRFGIKPLYYQWDGELLRFASELKPLILDRPRVVDLTSVYDLVARDWVDYRPETFFTGTVRLPPAQAILVGPRGFKQWKWWDLPAGAAARSSEIPSDEREIVERVREQFHSAVSLCLRSDVPVGTCLSGGLDSSAIVMSGSRQLDHPMQVFSVGYDAPQFDERVYAREVAECAGAQYHEVVPDGEDLLEVMERIVWHQEEPAAGPGLYSQWQVMALAQQNGMKVLLDGQGGDELFGGYHRYAIPYLQDLARQGRLGDFARDIWKVGRRQGLVETTAKVFLAQQARPLFEWGRRTFGQGKDRVVHPDLDASVAVPEPSVPDQFESHLSNVLGWEITTRFLPSLLRYEDRNSMAHSIETRLPFLDYRLVELVFALPPEYRIRGTTTKWVLREALGELLPASVRSRRDKMGYETPMDLWFRGRYQDSVRDLLLSSDSRTRAYLWRPSLERELNAYFAGHRPIGLQVWRWLHLEMWLRTFVDSAGTASLSTQRAAS